MVQEEDQSIHSPSKPSQSQSYTLDQQPMNILEQSGIEQVEEHVEEIERAQLVALGVQSHEDSIEERDVIELQH